MELSSGNFLRLRFRATCASLECIRPMPLVNLSLAGEKYRIHTYQIHIYIYMYYGWIYNTHLYHIICCRSWNGKMYSIACYVYIFSSTKRREENYGSSFLLSLIFASSVSFSLPLSISVIKINDPKFYARYFIIGIIYDKFMITFWRIMCTLHTKSMTATTERLAR